MSELALDYKVKLEVFEGPLDLLLYLVKKEEVPVWEIPISRITEQYLQYLDLMRDLNLDVAGEFILMAATLAHIKSKELLPKDPTATDDDLEEGDPRAELIRRLLEYQKYKNAAEDLAGRPILDRDTFGRGEAAVPDKKELAALEERQDAPLEVSLFALLDAFKKVIERIPPETFHDVGRETISVAEKAKWLATLLQREGTVAFHDLFRDQKRKVDVVATFLALLEMVRLKMLTIHQALGYGAIQIQSKIPDGADLENVLSGTDLEKAFSYGVAAKTMGGILDDPKPAELAPAVASAEEEDTNDE